MQKVGVSTTAYSPGQPAVSTGGKASAPTGPSNKIQTPQQYYFTHVSGNNRANTMQVSAPTTALNPTYNLQGGTGAQAREFQQVQGQYKDIARALGSSAPTINVIGNYLLGGQKQTTGDATLDAIFTSQGGSYGLGKNIFKSAVMPYVPQFISALKDTGKRPADDQDTDPNDPRAAKRQRLNQLIDSGLDIAGDVFKPGSNPEQKLKDLAQQGLQTAGDYVKKTAANIGKSALQEGWNTFKTTGDLEQAGSAALDKAVGSLGDTFSSLTDSASQLFNTFSGEDVAGTLMSRFGGSLSEIGSSVEGLFGGGAMAGAETAGLAGAETLGVEAGLAAGPIGWGALGIAAVGTGIYEAATHWSDISNWFRNNF